MQPDKVFTWGREYREYTQFFALSAQDLQRSILDCAGGAASFNVELTKRGGRIVSCDPLYTLSTDAIRTSLVESAFKVASTTEPSSTVSSEAQALGRRRLEVMAVFLADYAGGLAEGRYRGDALPALPFTTQQFDLALCSHLLFSYSDVLDEDFHLRSILELCRVAREVRIFPVTKVDGSASQHLAPILAALAERKLTATLSPVQEVFATVIPNAAPRNLLRIGAGQTLPEQIV